MVSSTPRPHFTPGKDPVPIVQEAGWAPRPVWTGGTSLPHRDSMPDPPARSQSLYRLSYPNICMYIYVYKCLALPKLIKSNIIYQFYFVSLLIHEFRPEDIFRNKGTYANRDYASGISLRVTVLCFRRSNKIFAETHLTMNAKWKLL